MSIAMLGFSGNDAFLKSVSADLALSQAVFLRSLATTLLIGAVVLSQRGLRFRPGRRDRRLIGVRSLGEIGGTVCFLTALFNMPIANATAILQSLPLAITLAAALLFDEPVGWRRYLAIAVGFLGVLLIIRPGSSTGSTPTRSGRSRRSSSSSRATSRPGGCRPTCRARSWRW